MDKIISRHGLVDNKKVSRVLEEMERNIKADLAGRVYDVTRPTPPKPKPDRTLEDALYAELTLAERAELSDRCKEKAYQAWLGGDNELKYAWGGW